MWISGLTLLGLALRIPFTSHILYHWDSINYALALEHYNIANHQPQPPGYILYVMLTRLVNALVNYPQWTFVGLNILGSTLAAIFLFMLGKAMFKRPAGIVAALYLLFCPLFWFYSEIALPHVIDGLATTVLAWLFYRATQQKGRSFLPAAILLGLVGGFRQQTLVFMIPLAIYAMRKARFSQMVLAGGTAFLVFLCSFIPMILLSGGWQAYRQDVSILSDSFFTQTSILMGGGMTGMVRNVEKWAAFTVYSLSLAGIPLIIWAVWKIRKLPTLLREDRAWFLAMWIMPSLVFYTIVHMGGHGLIFSYLPAVILIAAKALVNLIEAAQERWRTKIWTGALGAILIADVLLFAVIFNRPLAGVNLKIVNWATIRANDRYFANRFSLIQNNFDPQQSVIIATTWRHPQYYLPQFHTLSAPCGTSEHTLNINDVVSIYEREYKTLEKGNLSNTLSTPIHSVIFFDESSECLLSPLPQSRIQSLAAEGETVYSLKLEPGEALEFNEGKLSIQLK